MKKQDLKYYISGGVALMTFVVYLASLQNDFVEWDDSQYVFENLHIRFFDLAFLKWAFFDFYAANWHPLTWISHALDYAVWGLNPLGHHLTNNILHAVNTFLVVLVVARLLEQQSNGRVVEWSSSNDSTTQRLNSSSSLFTIYDSRFILITSGVTGLLFGLHPLHVESVAWVAERKDLLCAFFYLLSIIMYMRYAGRGNPLWLPFFGRPQGAAPTRPYFLSLCFFILALMSKPMAVSLPVVLLILDWYPFQRITSFKTFKASFMEKIPFVALSIASSVLTVLAQRAGEAVTAIETIPLSTRILVALKSLIAYLWKMIAPLRVVPYYPYPNDASPFSIEYLSGIILVVVITAVSIVRLKRQKLLLSVWMYYVVTLLPVLGLVQVGGQSMADRYAYLPSISPFLIMGLVIAWSTEKILKQTSAIKYSGVATGILLLAAISFLTFRQIEVWKNTFSLWTYVIEKEPERVPLAYNNRGQAFYLIGQLDQAIEDFNKAIILDPASFKAYLNRGAAFINKGQFDQANADFDKAIALNPSYSEAYNAKGSLFGMSGYFDKAIEQFSKAIEINPDYSVAYGNRGSAYSMLGQNSRALEDLAEAVRLDPFYADNYLNRGNVYLATGSRGPAVSDFQRACDLGNSSGCVAVRNLQK
jgi:protein O-mannosyl-transferase